VEERRGPKREEKLNLCKGGGNCTLKKEKDKRGIYVKAGKSATR